MSKKVLFLLHSNNEADWFLPLVAALAERPGVQPVVLLLRGEEESLTNPAFRRILEDSGAAVLLFDDIFAGSFARRKFLELHRRLGIVTGFVPVKEMLSKGRFFAALLKVFYILMERSIKYLPEIIFPRATIEDHLSKIEPSLLVVTNQRIRKNRPYFRDKRSYATSRTTIYCKERKIPVFMMPHGMNHIVDEGEREGCGIFEQDKLPSYGDNELVPPDIYVTGFEEKDMRHPEIIGPETKVLALGSIRYDNAWECYQRGISLESMEDAPDNKAFKILYVHSPAGQVASGTLPEVLKSISVAVPGSAIWVKVPAARGSGTDTAVIGEGVKIFGEGTDISWLMAFSDLVISPDPEIIIKAALDAKTAVLYAEKPGDSAPAGDAFPGEAHHVLRTADPEKLTIFCCRAAESAKGAKGAARCKAPDDSVISRYVRAVENSI